MKTGAYPKEAYSEKRKSRKWWTIDGDTVRRVTGWSCAPANPDSWWCPEVGYTLQEEHHLYESEMDALDDLGDQLRTDITDKTESLGKIIKRIRKL